MTERTITTQRCDPEGESCHLCGDEAVPARVVDVDLSTRTATVEVATGTATVAVDLVEARIGDVLLIHLGFAIGRLELE